MKILLLALALTTTLAQAELINPIYTPGPVWHDYGPYETKIHEGTTARTTAVADSWAYIYDTPVPNGILKGGTGDVWEFDQSHYIVTLALRVKVSTPTIATCALMAGPAYNPTKQVLSGTRKAPIWRTVINPPLTPRDNISGPDINYQMTVSDEFPVAFNGLDGEVKVEVPNIEVKANTTGSVKLVCKSDTPITVMEGGYLKVKQDKYSENWIKAATLAPLDPGSYVISNNPSPGSGRSGDSWVDVVNRTYNTGFAITAKLCEVKDLRFADASTDDWGRARYYADLILVTRSTAQANQGVPLDCASPNKTTRLGRLYLQSCVGTVENDMCKLETPVCPEGWDLLDGRPVIPVPLCKRFNGTSA